MNRKRVISLLLCIVLAISPLSVIQAVQRGASGGVSNPSGGRGGGEGPTILGYGFRFFLYNYEKNPDLLKGDTGSYKAASHIADELDDAAYDSAFYANVESDMKAYCKSKGNKRWYHVSTLTESEVNSIPGITGYHNPASRVSTDFKEYAEIFNGVQEEIKANGMSNIIKWFSKNGVDTKGMTNDNTYFVIEPVIRFDWDGHFLITYQNARAYDGTKIGAYDFFNFNVNLREQCQVSGDVYTPVSSTRLTDFAIAYMGGFYEKKIVSKDDCKTQAYDSSSGYAFFGNFLTKDKAASNVIVVVDGSKVKTYTTLNLRKTTGETVYDGEEWKNKDNVLGVNEDTLDEYALSMYDIYRFSANERVTYKKFFSTLENLDNIKISKTNQKIKGATHNVGYRQEVGGLSYGSGATKKDTSPISQVIKEKTELKYSEMPINEKTEEAVEEENKTSKKVSAIFNAAYTYSSEDYKEKSGIPDKATLGVSIEVLMKGEKIKSHVVNIKASLTGSTTTKVTNFDYTNTENGTYVLPEKAMHVIAVPNYDSLSYKEKVLEKLGKEVSGTDPSKVIDSFKNFFSSSKVEMSKKVDGGEDINFGCTTKDNELYGYTIYVLEVVVPASLSAEGDFELQDYQLNYVYPSILKGITGSSYYATIRPDLWNTKPTKTDKIYCENNPKKVVGYLYEALDYRIRVSEIKAKGDNVTADNKLGSTKIFLKNNPFGTRSQIKNTKTFDTSNGTTYALDYAFNQVRSRYGNDKRTISTLSKQDINKDYAKNVLLLDYGNQPKTVVNANILRNSECKIGKKLTDTLGFTAVYALTNSRSRYETTERNHKCTKTIKIGNESFKSYCSVWYQQRVLKSNVLKAFNFGPLTTNEVVLNMSSIAKKYSTDSIEVGKNPEKEGIQSLRPTTTEKIEKIKSKQGYSIALTKNTERKLTIYPEVPMLAYEYSGDTYNGTTKRIVKTIGEKKRKFNSSSLYIIAVKGSDKDNDVEGTLISDTFDGGTGRRGTPIIPAGSDFTLTTGKNSVYFDIDLYGYSVDVINKSKDSTMSQKGKTIKYTDIIEDNSDVYKDWGNTQTTNLFNDFKDFTNRLMQKENFTVDTTLRVKGKGINKEYSNFNASFGKLADYTVKEEYVYPLNIKLGKVVEDENYKAFIRQVAEDYDTTEAEAEKIVKDSGILKSVLKSIESVDSYDNNSQGEVKELGNKTHWYDEEVKTVVVRRYKATPDKATFENIMLSDKLDYNTTQNLNGRYTNDYNVGWFELKVYLNNEIDVLKDFTLFSPKKKNWKEAVKSGSALISGLHINKCDFRIMNSDTSEF